MECKYNRVYDFSVHNGEIDWDKLKSAGVDFVMLRAGYGQNNIDQRFCNNAAACVRLSIPFGIYWFSYAYTVEMAEREAGYAVAAVQKYRTKCPVVFDLEYDTLRYAGTKGVVIGKELATDMAAAFCSYIVRAGFEAWNYANLDYLKNMFDESLLQYPLWYARYNKEPGRADMVMWQYSSSGAVPGVTGKVDLNLAYREIESSGKEDKEINGALEAHHGEGVYSLQKDGQLLLTLDGIATNFRVKEFRCKDGSDEIHIDRELITILQHIRNHFGQPVIINSGYRTVGYNNKVKGAARSLHLFGQAADIRIEGCTPLQIAKYAESIGVDGIGMYGTFTHVDSRSNKYYWVNESKNSVATFGGAESTGRDLPPTGTILLYGDQNKYVAWLQEALNQNGACLQVDGIFGIKTDEAVERYQMQVGIQSDGIAGDITIGHLTA